MQIAISHIEVCYSQPRTRVSSHFNVYHIMPLCANFPASPLYAQNGCTIWDLHREYVPFLLSLRWKFDLDSKDSSYETGYKALCASSLWINWWRTTTQSFTLISINHNNNSRICAHSMTNFKAASLTYKHMNNTYILHMRPSCAHLASCKPSWLCWNSTTAFNGWQQACIDRRPLRV